MAPNGFLGLAPTTLSSQLSSDITRIDQLLGRVLGRLHGPEFIDLARSLHAADADLDPTTLFERFPALRDPDLVRRLLRAYTVLFQLLNLSELKEIIRVNRQREATAVPDKPRTETIRDAIVRLRNEGLTAPQVQEVLHGIDIGLTLTAHPTEARRQAILDKLLSIAARLGTNLATTDPLAAPLTANALTTEADVERLLTALWQTDEIGAAPVTVTDEVRHALYFFRQTILPVVPWLYRDLRAALREVYPEHSFEVPIFLRYSSWIGGDRDGNPNVSAAVTRQTLRRHRRTILRHYLAELTQLRKRLTISARASSAGVELLESCLEDRDWKLIPDRECEKLRTEPYVLKFTLMRRKLLANLRGTGGYRDVAEFINDLELVQRCLRADRLHALADEGRLADLVIQARTFGFHLAELDVRQHSRQHELAVAELLRLAGVLPADQDYTQLGEPERVALLTRELAHGRPLLARSAPVSAATREVLGVFAELAHAQRSRRGGGVRAYVISMTHGLSDVLEVLLLAKERDLWRWEWHGERFQLSSSLDIVPLFETITDLEHAHGLMAELFAHPLYRQHLEARGGFQEIMLGYSDSSKDGGYLAANLALHDAQARLAETCRQAGVSLRLFHGRGGTVGRGGGRANRAILSQPPGSFEGRIRITEQGEVISFRYSLRPIAHRHLEQLLHAALIASVEQRHQSVAQGKWEQVLRPLAATSRAAYRALVHDDPEFWSFYTQATPIAYISRLPIASRPVSRSSQTLTHIDELRAIPWVFAWVQNRMVVPGWYGLGTALQGLVTNQPAALATLRAMYRDWPFFRTVIDHAQHELLRAHLPTAKWYAARVKPPELGQRIYQAIQEEFARSRELIHTITGQSELVEYAPVMRHVVEVRNPAVVPLNKIQLAVMNQIERAGSEADARPWVEAILVSIAGLAAAMQSTG